VKPLPLRTSLALAYTGILSLVLTALGVGYHSALVRQLDASVTEGLEDKSRGLHGFLQFKNGAPVLVYNKDDPEEVAFINDATRYYQLYDANTGTLLVQSPGIEALGLRFTPAEVAEFRSAPQLQDIQTDRGRLRLSTSVITPAAGEAYIVQVGELLDRVDAALAGFDRLMWWRILAGLVFAALAGRWLAGRALAPLSRLADATRGIGITNLHDRLSVRGAHDELDQVAHAFNMALARVEQSVGEMRQFSAALAHELRTPLAILRGEAELALTQTPTAADMRDRLVSQIDEYDRLTRLINQILTLARAEAGEITIARHPVDLSALGSAVAEQIEPVAAARGLILTCEMLPGVSVEGDAGWLQRLLLILLDNAIKFTPEGGRISMTLSSANHLARLSIADSGIGISADAMPHLFERFYRDDSSRPRQAGAGLGLALAKWIAERHDATIEVQSTPGVGSTFIVNLRALPVSADAAARPGQPLSSSGRTVPINAS
jgi:heavy metal sensor kinase